MHRGQAPCSAAEAATEDSPSQLLNKIANRATHLKKKETKT